MILAGTIKNYSGIDQATTSISDTKIVKDKI